ncbi:MAG: hypothetical protein RIS24_995 [Verrucomicrobiota bacterium]|jgi:hypothetical protein
MLEETGKGARHQIVMPIDPAQRDSTWGNYQRPERQSGDYFEVNSWTRIRRYSI